MVGFVEAVAVVSYSYQLSSFYVCRVSKWLFTSSKRIEWNLKFLSQQGRNRPTLGCFWYINWLIIEMEGESYHNCSSPGEKTVGWDKKEEAKIIQQTYLRELEWGGKKDAPQHDCCFVTPLIPPLLPWSSDRKTAVCRRCCFQFYCNPVSQAIDSGSLQDTYSTGFFKAWLWLFA